jgi:hypothetical protein
MKIAEILLVGVKTQVNHSIIMYVCGNDICDNVCQCLAAGCWFSPGTPVSSINKTDFYDIAEILLLLALSTIN